VIVGRGGSRGEATRVVFAYSCKRLLSLSSVRQSLCNNKLLHLHSSPHHNKVYGCTSASETAGGEKQGGEEVRSRAETPRVAEFYPRLWQERLFSEGPAFALRANAHPSEHTPGLPRKTVSYSANEKL